MIWTTETTRFLTALALMALATAPARADRIENEVATFAALDKVTARISVLEVPLGQTVQFGALKVTPRVCFSRPPTDTPKTTSFVEVEETMLDGKQKKLFSGWMFAESPGLNAVEHPVYDVWLTDCQKPMRTATSARSQAGDSKAGAAASGQQGQGEEPLARRRPRR